jgi:3-oxoacyl-[acyl-carrier protein] reductase
MAVEGGRLSLVARDQVKLEQVAGAIGGNPFPADLGDSRVVNGLIDRVEAAQGPIDILVNNAGLTRDNILLRLTEADWDAVLDANLKGAFHTTRGVIKGMMKRRHGRIINITSVVGLSGNKGQANYAASKAGLIGFTKSVAKEYASRGILANCVAPGFIETDMTGALPDEARATLLEDIALGRLGRPDDVAGAVLFLASDLAGYITGQVLVVDGGLGF